MKTPDPKRATEYGQPNYLDEDRSEEIQVQEDLEIPEDFDPLESLLAEEELTEVDNERLYTDEFIRANENASRSLFLGFLGIALLGTSLFAWFILSQPQSEETDAPTPPTDTPVNVPSAPPETIPDLRLDSNSPESPAPSTPGTVPGTLEGQPNPGTQAPETPLVFPANPTNPGTTTLPDSDLPSAGTAPAPPPPLDNSPNPDNNPVAPLPEGNVPPPPPPTTP